MFGGLLVFRDSAYWTVRGELGLHALGCTYNYGAFRGGLQTAGATTLQRLENFNFAAATKDLHGYTLVVTMNQEIDGGIDQPKVFDSHVIHV